MPTSRKLAAIVFVDIVGYTGMMAKNEQSALQLVEALRKILYPLVRKHGGEVLKELGDGALISFESALEATHCAVTLQQSVKDVPKLRLRIGIHLGDILVEKKDVFGSGVNVAAHVQPLAVPGGVVVTEDVWKLMRNQSTLSFISLGPRRLKGLGTSMRVFAVKGDRLAVPDITQRIMSRLGFQRGLIATGLLALVVFSYLFVFEMGKVTAGEVPSIAILYLKNLGSETDEPYAYGITQDLIVDVAKAGLIRVAPMKNILAFQQTDVPVEKIAEQLRVRYVMEGNLSREVNFFRLHAKIVEAATGEVIWDDHFETRVSEAAALQGKLAQAILNVLDVESTTPVVQAITKTRTTNPEAYELYLRGKYLFNTKKSREDVAGARDLFEKAIILDSAFVFARIGLGETYDLEGEYGRAEQIYQNALRIAQFNGEKMEEAKCLWRLGVIREYVADYPGALDYCERSLEILEELGDREGQSRTLSSLGIVYRSVGEYTQSLGYFVRSLKIKQDLGDRRGEAVTLNNVGNIYFDRGDYAKALGHFHQSLKIQRELGERHGEGIALANIGTIHQTVGEYDKALSFFMQDLTITQELGDRKGEGQRLHNIGNAYYFQGDSSKALEYFTRSLKINHEVGDRSTEARTIGNLGMLYLAMKEFRKAVDSLKKSARMFDQIGEKQNLILAVSQLALAKAKSGNRTGADTSARKVEELLAFQPKPLEYVQILWNLVQVYTLLGVSERATQYLEMAYTELQASAEKITDDTMLESYLTKVKNHREIIGLWEKDRKPSIYRAKGIEV